MGEEIRVDWRSRIWRGSLLAHAVLSAVAVLFAGLLVTYDSDDWSGMFYAAGLAVIPVTGCVLAAQRGPGDLSWPAATVRSGYYLFATVALGVAEGVVLVPLSFLLPKTDSAGVVSVGAALGPLLGGLGLSILALLFGGSALFVVRMHPSVGLLGRFSLPIVFVSMIVMSTGAAIGTPEDGRERGLLGLLYALSGQGGVASTAWLNVGRAGAVVFVASAALLVWTLKRDAAIRKASSRA